MEFLLFLSEQWLLVSILLVLVALLVFTESRKGGAAIGVHELTRLVNSENALVLDLRESKEFAAGHITGAINIPFAKFKDRAAELEKYRNKPIILVDKMGQHASSTGNQLARDGYAVRRLRGGMSEWTGQNLPVIKGQ